MSIVLSLCFQISSANSYFPYQKSKWKFKCAVIEQGLNTKQKIKNPTWSLSVLLETFLWFRFFFICCVEVDSSYGMLQVHAYASTVTINENTLFIYAVIEQSIDFLQHRCRKNQHLACTCSFSTKTNYLDASTTMYIL